VSDLIPRLLAGGPVVTDGALGTELQARGLTAGELPDSWNFSHPDLVEQVIRAYVEAGSQVVLTVTFRSNRITLAEHGLAGRVADLNRAGVEIARRAAAGRARVFGSIGPCGKLLVSGEVSPEDVSAAFFEQALAMAEAGADAIVVETMSDLEEAKLATGAAARTGLPVVACMVFDSGRNKDRTMMGNTPEQAARELATAGADVVGANCGQGIAGYVPICRRLREATDRPLWIKANAGLPELSGGRTVYPTNPAEFASHVPALVQAGAGFIGGCCGTNPDFIRAIVARVGS
jgi:5-methyltetrahydrofolate--homocysteine methyltransferase